MSKGLNRIQIIGNLGHNPEVRYTSSGTAVTTFDVAVNESWMENGQKKDRTEWFRCVAWNKLGEICGEYLSKGMQVFIEGRLQTREYDGKDGTRKKVTELIVREMIMLGDKQPNSPHNEDGEIPF